MILHPGILSLLAGSFLVTIMMGYSAFLGYEILRKWDFASSSMLQLSLERKTYLVSTLMNYVLGFEILSLLLFIYTVDDIHRTFVGAMCATGSLNANPIGWYVLATKIAVFFLSATWIAINYLDQRAVDYPLVKKKYAMLFLIALVVLADTVLQVSYFAGLKPDIITSCCGSLFSEGGVGIASSLSSLPLKPMMGIFYVMLSLYLLNAVFALRLKSAVLRRLLPLSAVALFAVAISSMVTFISLYFYEIPTHHCPFDILQAAYGFVGFPLYGSLFGGVFFGMMTGLAEPLGGTPSLREIVPRAQRTWLVVSLVLVLLFAAISSWPILFSSFTLEGYL